MAFYRIWTGYREKNGWTYTMDRDAWRIAIELGKDVRPLETIEEQVEALNGVPLERIVSFLARTDWKRYAREYVRHYLAGDLDGLMGTAREFPTFCDSIIHRRDPILYERMAPFFERGNAIAFVGIVHCRKILTLFIESGYRVGSPVAA
jgi:uncharacterized protein YbaP (TraB family)